MKVFEENDCPAVAVNDADVAKNFFKAVQVPKDYNSLHFLYKSELESIESLQCRATFFNILAYGYKSYEGIVQDIDMEKEKFDQLQNLIICELQDSQSQAEKI